MKLGIIAGFGEEDFKMAASKGLSFIEICYNVGSDCQEFYAQVDEIKARIKKYGVEIGSIGRWGSDKIAPDGSIIDEEFKNSRLLIDICAELGCKVFNTGVNYVDSLSKFQNLTCAVTFLQKLVFYGSTKGVKVATYNCDWNNFVRTPDIWDYTHGHIRDLGIKYDPTHCINSGSGDYLGETAAWGDRFYHVHIKGTINVNGDHIDDPPAGLDMIDWGAFMGLLYAKHYDANLSIEPHSDTWRGELSDFGVDFTINHISRFIYK